MTQDESKKIYSYIPDRLNYKSKCIDCERQVANLYGEGRTSLGIKTKCFDCQRDMMEQTIGFNGGFGT